MKNSEIATAIKLAKSGQYPINSLDDSILHGISLRNYPYNKFNQVMVPIARRT